MPKRPENADDAGGRPAPRQKAEEQHTDNEEEKRGNDRPFKPKTMEEKLRDLGINEFDKNAIRMIRRLQAGNIDGTQDVDSQDDFETTHEVLTYAETLHNGLKKLWVPMVYLGRMPFRLLLKKNQAIIAVRKRSPAYIACFIMFIFTWILFIWITLGIFLLIAQSNGSSKQTAPKTTSVSILLAKRFWRDTFILWTTLLQAAVSSTHILQKAREFALLIKGWYQILDLTKIEVSRTLNKYIITQEILLVIFLLATIVTYCVPGSFPHMYGSGMVVVIALGQPIIALGELGDEDVMYAPDHFYFNDMAFLGLLVYIIAILFSWLYVLQFMVFCRCFRKGLKCINQRIAMILEVDDVKVEGPNALRLSYEEIHKDYIGIASAGIKIGKIFSWTMCNYYLWAILVLVLELGEIFKFAKRDYRNRVPGSDEITLKEAGFDRLTPVQEITNDLVHFIVTTVCIFYVSHEGSGAHKEGKMSYELARYRGLVDCSNQLERNFIRSIWIIVSEKCPVHVSPGKFFGITNSTILTVFATAFTYFIFWAQSQGQLSGEGGSGNGTKSSSGSSDYNMAGKLLEHPNMTSSHANASHAVLPY